jgi:hypothetical protein
LRRRFWREAPLVEIDNEKELLAWLLKQPGEVSVAFAARAALRVLPNVGEARGRLTRGDFFADIMLPVFRATGVAWVAAKYPTQATNLRNAYADAADAARPAVFAAAYAAYAAANAANAAARATSAASAAFAAAAFWPAVSVDVTCVEEGATASVIAGSPLWPKGQPDEIQALWQEMKAALDAEKQDWDVWTDWYEARLAGKRSNQKLEIARAMISNEIWEEGPAKVNAEIKKLIKKHKPPPRQKKELKPSIVPKTSNTLPVPIENVPSAVSFGWSSKGTIAVVSGAFNWPVFPFNGGEQDHKDPLDTCRVLATDIARSIRSGRWNARSDYSETLDQYAAYLPAQPGECNFLLADAEARIIRAMFAAEQDFLPTPLAAKLKVLLEQHIGLRAYYPATEDFYESVRSGHLEAPLPIDAVEGFIQSVRDNTPTLFEPNVSQSLEGVAQPVPILVADTEAPRRGEAQPAPPPDPLGEVDPEKARRYTVGGAVNALWKAVLSGEKVGKSVEGWSTVIATLGPNVVPILEWLRSVL